MVIINERQWENPYGKLCFEHKTLSSQFNEKDLSDYVFFMCNIGLILKTKPHAAFVWCWIQYMTFILVNVVFPSLWYNINGIWDMLDVIWTTRGCCHASNQWPKRQPTVTLTIQLHFFKSARSLKMQRWCLQCICRIWSHGIWSHICHKWVCRWSHRRNSSFYIFALMDNRRLVNSSCCERRESNSVQGLLVQVYSNL